MKDSILLDRKEQKKAEKFEKLMLRMFTENMKYLINLYKSIKLPKSMFNESQREILKENFYVNDFGSHYCIIRERS